jgi:hypothetical protein
MSPAEVAAEEADDLRRIEAGEMSEAEALQRAAAWQGCADTQLAETAALEKKV